MSEVKIEYWDCDEDREYLRHENKDEAIEAHLDGVDDLDQSESIKVYGFAREVVDPQKFTAAVLKYANDYLGEKFDGEDGHEQNEAIKEAAAKFVQTYLDNYTVFACVLAKTEEVNVGEWVKNNRPDWLISR